MTSRLQSGLYTLQIAICDNNDYPMGQLTTPNSPVVNTVYSPYVVPAPVEYAAADDTVEIANSFAAERIRGIRRMGVSQLGAGTLTLSEFDDTFDALVMGYTLDTTTATQQRIAGHNVNQQNPPRIMLAFTPAATPANSLPNYDTIFTWGTLRRSALNVNSASGRNPNNRVYTLTKYLSTRTPWGQLFTASVINPNGGSDDEVIMYYDAPQAFATWTMNGTASGFNMPYALEYSEHSGSANLFYRDGLNIVSAAATILGGTAVAFTGSGTAGSRVVVVGPSTALLVS